MAWAVPFAVGTVLLGGCTGSEATISPSTSSSTSASETSVAVDPSVSVDPVSPSPEELPTGPSDSPVPVPSNPGAGKSIEAKPSAAPTQKARLDETAKVSAELTARIAKVEAVTAKPQGPGEVGGPAIAVTVEVSNKTDSSFDLTSVSVNLTDSSGEAGSGMAGPPATWLEGSLKAGQTRTGVYVFAVPTDRRDPVHVDVSLRADLPLVVFSGRVS